MQAGIQVSGGPGDWWGVALDVADTLRYKKVDSMLPTVRAGQKGNHLMSTPGGAGDG